MHDLVGRSSQLATTWSEESCLKMDVADGGPHAKGIAMQKKETQARLFTAVNHSSNSILTPHAEDAQQRMLLYTSKWRRAHNAVYWFDHKLAQDNGRVFLATCINGHLH